MKKIVVCYKWVVDETEIIVEGRTKALNYEKTHYRISRYDLNAIEAGNRIREATGCELSAVTCGSQAEASIKDVLSRGVENVYYVNDERLKDIDSSVTAKILARIIKKLGDVDLVICGEGSSDLYSQQTGPRLAALLGYPGLSYVNKLEVISQGIRAQRKLKNEIEVVEVLGPALVTVTPDINSPRLPNVPNIMGAGEKPAVRLTLEELGLDTEAVLPKLKTLNIIGVVNKRKAIRVDTEGSKTETAMKLAKQLQKDGVLD